MIRPDVILESGFIYLTDKVVTKVANYALSPPDVALSDYDV